MTSELDRLPPDQRAVLSLVLERGRSYSEVADMLAIPERAVRERAHAALDALANDSAVTARATLAGEAPDTGRPARGRERGPKSARSGSLGETRARRAAGPEADDANGGSTTGYPPPRWREPQSASSRRAGAILLAAIVVVIVVVVVLLSSGGGKSSHNTTTNSSTGTTSSSTSSTKPKLDKTIALTSAEPELKANGVAYVLSESGRRAFYVAAQGLPPSSGFFYAVWLYNSLSSSAPLGRAPTVSSNGRMEGGGPLPTDAGSYHELIITRETSTHPSKPGPVVLRGPFALH